MHKRFSLLWVTSVLFARVLAAQTITSGEIAGTVTDPSKSTVPKAQVTVTSDATNASQRTLTNIQGRYRVSFLPPRHYTVTVSAPVQIGKSSQPWRAQRRRPRTT